MSEGQTDPPGLGGIAGRKVEAAFSTTRAPSGWPDADDLGTFVSVVVIAAAPLLAGTVHDATITIVAGAMMVGLVSLATGLAADRRDLRVGVVVLVPLLFLVVPAAQSIPLPLWLRTLFDTNGTALLVENRVAAPARWPLSLDPSRPGSTSAVRAPRWPRSWWRIISRGDKAGDTCSPAQSESPGSPPW